jgi:hypothetical protein
MSKHSRPNWDAAPLPLSRWTAMPGNRIDACRRPSWKRCLRRQAGQSREKTVRPFLSDVFVKQDASRGIAQQARPIGVRSLLSFHIHRGQTLGPAAGLRPYMRAPQYRQGPRKIALTVGQGP